MTNHDKNFQHDRSRALAQIKTRIADLISDLAKSPLGDNIRDRNLPEFIETEQRFQWPAAALFIAGDLQEGRTLKQAFSRVSKRSSVDDDVAQNRTGRESAFADIFHALDIIERDFDLNYEPLSRARLQDWKKVHPMEDVHLEYAHRENQRYFMAKSLREIRTALAEIRDEPAIGFTPARPPKP